MTSRNRLAHETSPYLKQHADNPVDWYPWGEEALARARAERKPILLSIGYAACHWCHVMAHESFADPAIAAVMNSQFVNIKVDREERPDLDQIYQTAHALLARRSGGWPLTMFLTPEQQPFFGGTYFPPQARHGLPGFGDLLERVALAYRTHAQEIAAQNDALRAALDSDDPPQGASSELSARPRAAACAALAGQFDAHHGGFGGAPKFPHAIELGLLIERSAHSGDAQALHIVKHSLTRMAEGGLFDQLGGGFYRYSVDSEWQIPHFEKMLYDNGLLLALYADAFAVTREPLFAATLRATAQWLLREMQAPEGGYCSSLDADSEHEEGKFYVWTREQARSSLSEAEYALIAPHFGLDGEPNFEHDRWHLRVARPLAAIASEQGTTEADAQSRLASARAKLLARREQRVRPARDDKVLVSWNALAIIGLARASRVLREPTWMQSARRAMDFIRAAMWRDGRLVATYNDGRAQLNAYLDDYAFLLAAELELMQTDLRTDDLPFAGALADALIAHFEDRDRGGFYFTSHDHERLIHRPKSSYDNATPSGNGVAVQGLIRLGHLLGEPRYLAAAERALRAFQAQIEAYPNGHCSLLAGLAEWLTAPTVVVLRGPREVCVVWQDVLAGGYRPHVLIVNTGDRQDLPPILAPSAGDRAAAFVCREATCLAPIYELAELKRALADASAPAAG
jgi:hypothetical protein